MKTNRLNLFWTVLLFLSFQINSYSQIGVTSYSIYALGVNTSQNKPISGELKIFANRNIEDFILEGNIFYNFKPRTYHRFSIGLGMSFIPYNEFEILNVFTIPLQLEIYPLKEFRKLSLIFEFTPEINDASEVNLRSLWGIRYSFGELNNTN
jgi:hypothetical protein